MAGIWESTAPQLSSDALAQILSCIFKVNNFEHEGKQGARAEGNAQANALIRIQSTPVCLLSPWEQATDGL